MRNYSKSYEIGEEFSQKLTSKLSILWGNFIDLFLVFKTFHHHLTLDIVMRVVLNQF